MSVYFEVDGPGPGPESCDNKKDCRYDALVPPNFYSTGITGHTPS